MNCESCQYFQGLDAFKEGVAVTFGVCHRLPPTGYPYVQNGVIGGAARTGQVVLWPNVKCEDWCGEWRKSE